MFPSYWPVKAIDFPSGENRANISKPASLVRRRATPPATGTVYRSPAYVKTTWVPWIAGNRSRRASSGDDDWL